MVDHEVNGFLCESKNPEDLASKMEEMLAQNEESIRRMSHASRQIAVNKFDEKIVIEKYLDSISKV